MTSTPTSSSDWAAYNAARIQGGGVRPLTERGLVALVGTHESAKGLHAVELGSGAGLEAQYLLQQGMSVDTLDCDASVEATMAQLATIGRVRHRTGLIEEWDPLPEADMILANASLPFVPREHFWAVWQRIRTSLRPGGVFAADLFGADDSWASPDGTYLTRSEVDDLLDGLEVVELNERSEDGRSFEGTKHWHTFTVIARRPL